MRSCLKKYKASIADCYEYPKYLNEVLKNLYGDGYKDVVKKIKKQLGEFASQEQISEFIVKISA
jgi:hypothetical protein